ncbi:penicillin-binding protein activator [Corallococcus praedator]|uniref:Penicillin-binding protein activator n=2 Tax=Myxococcaceae TaxID=31 RepID=A0ABX9Q8B2_9BACT|nr:penicillin-binding protein activator [Corallococcus sp. CA047B]RKH20283.1 penicillin-binding protein activator [Corallococcus sp. CA031C]RKH92436.1 penicillin-binding protein activator [Corallococcus praedator]
MHPAMEVLSASRRALVVALALLLTACPKAPSQTDGRDTPDGEPTGRPRVEVKQDATANAALAQARAEAQAQPDKKKAAEAYLSVRKAYPATTAGQDALYNAGVLFFEAKDYANARKTFNELIFENPLYDQAEDAKHKLALSAMEVGAYRDAYQTLTSLAERAEGEKKEQLLREAARAAEGAGLYSQALTTAVKEAGEAQTPEDRAAAVAKVEKLVEGRADFIDIARTQEGLSPSNPAWPVLQFKLARIYYHLRDWTRLEETLQRFLRDAPDSSFAPQAKELLARATRRVEVRPRTVAVLLPMTGRYQPIGEAVLRGVKLALQGSDVELVVKDTQGDVNKTGQAMEQLAFDDGAIAALGPLLVDDTKRAALLAEELQVPLLTLSRQEGITDIGPYVFRNMLTNSAQARAIADYAMNVKGYKKFAVLYPNIPYGVELANEFWDEVVARGGAVRGAEAYTHDQTTFTSEAKRLVGRYYLEDRGDWAEAVRDVQGENITDAYRRRKAMEKARSGVEPIVDFEGLFIPDDWRRVSLVTPALAVEDIVTNACDPRDLERIRKTTGKKDLKTVTLFGTNQWSSPKGRSGLPELLERGGKFVTCSVYVDGFFVDSQRPATQKFVKSYREAYKEGGRDPGLLEAIGYDSARMVRQVLDKQRPNTRAAMREAMAGLKDFDGATGRTSFNDKREADKQLFLLSVDNKGVNEINVDKEKAAVRGSGS